MAKSYKLKFQGKELTPISQKYVEDNASRNGIDILNKKELFEYYERNKDFFETRLNRGLETFDEGLPQVIKDLQKLNERGYKFFVRKSEFTLNELIYILAKVELKLNEEFDTTGFTISYLYYDIGGKVVFDLPDAEDIEEIEENSESIEDVNDYISDFGITIYTSDKDNSKRDWRERKKSKETYYQNLVTNYQIAHYLKNE